MDKPKATPGPWQAVPMKHRLWTQANTVFPEGLWHIIEANNVERLPLATVDRGDDHDKQTRLNAEATARLIAAAPDLLEATKHAAMEWRLHGQLTDSCRVLEAAIAKAEGQ